MARFPILLAAAALAACTTPMTKPSGADLQQHGRLQGPAQQSGQHGQAAEPAGGQHPPGRVEAPAAAVAQVAAHDLQVDEVGDAADEQGARPRPEALQQRDGQRPGQRQDGVAAGRERQQR